MSKLRWMIIGASAAALVLCGGTTSVAAGANAAECPSGGALCLYNGEGFTGESLALTSLESDGTCVSLPGHGWTGPVRSVINTHRSSAALFANDNCVGGPYGVPANSSVASLPFSPVSVWVPAA
jgi:Peptidase inhibitor family I36